MSDTDLKYLLLRYRKTGRKEPVSAMVERQLEKSVHAAKWL